MTIEDATLIHEASVLAGIKASNERQSQADTDEIVVLLREMRAVTETHRLAVRIAAHFHVKMATEDRTLGDPEERHIGMAIVPFYYSANGDTVDGRDALRCHIELGSVHHLRTGSSNGTAFVCTELDRERGIAIFREIV